MLNVYAVNGWARGARRGGTSPLKLSVPFSQVVGLFFFSPPVSMCSHVTVLFLCVSQSLSMSHVPPPHTLSTNPTLLSTSREAGAENWGTEGCQTLASTAVHTKCLCSRISTYAVLAQQAKDPVSHLCKAWCTLWDFGVLTRQLLPGGEGAQVSELIFCTQTPGHYPRQTYHRELRLLSHLLS